MRAMARRIAAAVLLAVFGAAASPSAAQAVGDVRSKEWWLAPWKLEQAQRITDGSGVVVGMIDGPGIDDSVPELRGQILQGRGFGPGMAPDGIDHSAKAQHSTSVAALIAASGRGGHS